MNIIWNVVLATAHTVRKCNQIPRIIKKRLSTKSSPLLIREQKKLRVASPKSKVQQRINTKKN